MAGTSYTRQSTIADGNIITAALFNNEFNQILNAFAYASSSTTGHQHDGSAGQGGNIPKIGDQDFLNKIEVDSTNNRIGLFVQVSSGTVEQVRIQDGAIVPVTDSDVDLGTSSVRFKDAFVDSATVTGTVSAATVTSTGTTNIVTGVVTGDMTFTGADYNIVFDASASEIQFEDNAQLIIGTNNDLLIYHDGSNSLIKEQGTGSLQLRADTQILMGSAFGSTSLTVEGASGITVAASGATKLTVDSGGVNIPDDVILNIGSSDDLQIYHDGSNSVIKDAGTGNLNIFASTDVFIGTTSSTMANFDSTGAVDLYHNNSKKFETSSAGATITGNATVTGAVGAQTFNASASIDTPEIEVTTLKARDGSAAGSIADSTGVVTLASSVLTTADINGGTADNVVIGGSTAAAGTFTTGTIATADINGGAIDGTVIGGSTAAAGSFTSLGATGTVDCADLTMTDSSPTITINDSDGTNTFGRVRQVTGTLKFESRNDTSHGSIEFGTRDDSDTLTRLKVGTNGDINFYDNDGTTIGAKWDASASRLGIGLASPTEALDVVGSIKTTTGIVFTDASATGTADANTLDAYEEGTWTPVVRDATTGGNAATMQASTGHYTLIGNQCTVVARFINIDPDAGSPSAPTGGNTIYITGLPFAPVDFPTGVRHIGSMESTSITYQNSIQPRILENANYIVISNSQNNGSLSTLDFDALNSSAADIFLQVTYTV